MNVPLSRRSSLRISIVSVLVLLGLVALSVLQARISEATNVKRNSSLPSDAVQEGPKRPDFQSAPGEILVRFRSGSATALKTMKGGVHAESVLDATGRELPMQIEKLDSGPELVDGLRVVRVSPEATGRALEALKQRPDVIYAEPNYIRRKAKLPNDPRFLEMWGLKNTGQSTTPGGNPGKPGNDIRAEQAWDVTTGSKSVVVGIIDEGIDVNHEDLKDNVWTNPAEIAGNGVDDDGNGFIDDVNGWDFAHNDNTVFDYTLPSYPPPDTYTGDIDDHGTHVAGILGATGNNGIGVVGVNWQVSMMPLKFLQAAGGTSANLLKAFSYAKMMRELWASSGGTKGANIRVLNNSYAGGGFSQAELDAIRALSDAGILFVIAAGNEGLDNDMFPTYPANYRSPNMITVAASTGGGPRASFSNYGSGSVNMTAPGDYILSTTPRNTYNFFSGTSMATPFVAGSAALICAAYPNISVQKLRSVVMYSGYVATWQYIYSYPISTGRSMDANSALQAVTSTDTTSPSAVSHLGTFTGPTFPNVGLQWGAPGDDGNTGKVAAYEVRFSDNDLSTPAAFELSRPLAAPTPDVAGSGHSLAIKFPWRHSSGFVGVRAVDDVGNAGPISSIAFSVSPDVADPYIVTESASTTLSTGGTPLGLVADDQYKSVSLPFNFKFYEGSWGGVTVSTNGTLYFGTALTNPDAESTVRRLNGYRMIAGGWDDLRTDRRPGDDVYVVTPDADRIIFRWQAVTYDTPLEPDLTRGENPVNFEIELQSTGKIILRYGDGNQKLLPVVGISAGWPDPYLIDSHTSEAALKDLTNAGTVIFDLRNPQPPVSANLAITMTGVPDPVGTGALETYSLRVSNNGPYDAPGTVVTDVLPAGLSFVSCTTSAGICSGPAPGSNGTVTINLGQLNSLVSQNISIVTQVTADSGSITNTVTVKSSRLDTDLANNSVSTTVQVVPIGAFDSVKAISSSYFVNFAVKNDGSVWGWGRNDYGVGVLGTGDTSLGQSSRPIQAQTLTGAIAVSTGGTHTLALKSDGTVWAWGSNGLGECGQPPPYPRLTPVAISGVSNVTVVAAGYGHSMALKNDGTVWVWGANGSGELGLGSADGNPHPTPAQVPGLAGVTAIWAGTGLSAAVRSDGTVWTWGDNHNGQLGSSGGSLSSPTQVSGVSGVTAVSSSFNHVIVRKSDGTVMCWGSNSLGQTGSTVLGNINPTPVQVSGLAGAIAVAAGSRFSLALKSDGTVWGWGQIPGSSTQSSTPSMINGLTNVISIAAGDSHGLALLRDGTLRSWGENNYGQLGDATTLSRQSPVQVTGTLTVAQPIFNPVSGYTSSGPFQVQVVVNTSGAVIHYTVNGPDPTESDPTVTSGGSVSITQNSQLKARAYKSGWLPSVITSANYVVVQNAIDNPQNLVRQHYQDFLGRDPDQSGLDFWTNQITSCGTDPVCIETKRINVSASFFLSIEFQQTGYLVERFYKVAYGDAMGNSTFGSVHQLTVPVIRFSEFLQDTHRIGQGVIVLQPGWEQLLESNKQAYAFEFVQTARFTAANAFPTTMSPAQFVDKLNQNAGNVLSATERTSAISLFGGASDTTNTTARAQAVRIAAEDQDLYGAEYNRAFVLAQYFGYLRRNPNDPQDTDYTGYDFWLTKLNQFNGNYLNAEMVKAFLSSIEYRHRFGS